MNKAIAILMMILALSIPTAWSATNSDTQTNTSTVAKTDNQQTPQPTSQQSNTANTANTTDKATGDVANPPANNNDTFIPSESISEDLAVSFPVDI